MNLQSLLAFINHGGIVSWILIILYFMTWTISIERMIFFVHTYFPQKNLYDLTVSPLASFEKYKNSQIYHIYQLYNSRKKTTTNTIFQEQVEREAFGLIEEMKNHLWILSSVSNIAPLLGLLGTILGLISSFQIMATLGSEADVAAFASGIWEAMSTTAVGLIVAIPALFVYKIFDHLVNKRSNQITYTVSLLNEKFNELTNENL